MIKSSTHLAFKGAVGQHFHIGFDDHDSFTGSAIEVLNEYRRVRDEIMNKMSEFGILANSRD